MLEVLSPQSLESNPALAGELEHDRQTAAFVSKVINHQAALPEIIEGLKQYPWAAPDIAANFVRTGSNTVELLPAFTQALFALAPPSDASQADRARAFGARQQIADAMQKIAPELPKRIFGRNDTFVLQRIMRTAAGQADSERFQKISAARRLAEWPAMGAVRPFDVPPEHVRRLLAAIRDADAATYEALAAKVSEIDPHFFDAK